MLVAFQLSLPRWSSDRRPLNALALSRTYHRSMPSSAAQKLSLVLWRAFERIHCFEGLVVSKEALSWARKVKGGVGFRWIAFSISIIGLRDLNLVFMGVYGSPQL